jgi:hypothetical protein
MTLLGGLGSLLGGGTTPEEQQRSAIFQAGLAALASAQQPGGTFGGSLFSGFQAGAGALQQAQQNAFQSKRLKAQEEREDRLAKQETDRLKIAQAEESRRGRQSQYEAGYRGGKGLLQSKNPVSQFQLVSRDPEFGAALANLGIDPSAVTTPDQVQQVASQLVSMGELGVDPLKPRTTPAEIQEFEYYQSLSPEDKATYIQVKRNSQPYQLNDFAGGQVLLNRVTGQITPQTTADQEGQGRGVRAAGEAGGKTLGEARAVAQLDLPRVENNATQAIQAIEELKAAPGLKGIFGLPGAFPNFPGSAAADAQTRLDQVLGKTFLEAFNTLKGAGQITEIEGKKATDAIARLQKAQSVEAATAALTELQQVIATGLEVARKKATGATRAVPSVDYSSLSDDYIKRQLGL